MDDALFFTEKNNFFHLLSNGLADKRKPVLQLTCQSSNQTSSVRIVSAHLKPVRGEMDNFFNGLDKKNGLNGFSGHKNIDICVVNPFSNWIYADLAKP